MSKSEILAALKSLEATIDNYFAGINNNLIELQSSLDSRSSHLQPNNPTPDFRITQPSPITHIPPIHFPNQKSDTQFSDLNHHNPYLNAYATRPTVPIDEESRSITKLSTPIDSSDLRKSQSLGDLSEKFPSDLQESLLDLKDSRSSPPTNIADPSSALSKPAPQLQTPLQSTPPLPIKRWNPKEIKAKQGRWFCYNRDSKRSPLCRSHSRLLRLVDVEEWCKSSSPERGRCALSVFVHPPLQVVLGGEPPPVITASIQGHQIQVMEFLFGVMLCGEPPPVTYFHPFGQRFKSVLISVRFN